MPVLENHLHERLAQGVARGLSQIQAAIEAGYKPNSAGVSASRALKRPEVAARVDELRAAADTAIREAVAVDRQGVLARLERNYEVAIGKKDVAAANRAAELIGKEMGMFVDRRMEVKSPLEALSASQLKDLALLAACLRERGLLPGTPAPTPDAGTQVLDGTVVRADPVLIEQGGTPDVGAE